MCEIKSIYKARPIGHVSYIRISLLFLFPVKDGKLSTGVNAQRFLISYRVTVSLQ